MKNPSDEDLAGMLTEVGVSPPEADPHATVGSSAILRSETTAGEIPAFRPRSGEGERQVTLGKLIQAGKLSAYYTGLQHSMRRRVAVRTVSPNAADPVAAAGRVLSEAWMLGALEHPNILPVYGAGKDENGFPLILMRPANTVSWTEVLADPAHPLGVPRRGDPIEFNLRRMVHVCRALEHAHARGVVHRDVKPDNIMIDEDGSVYLHGWSLGVSIVPDPSGRWPLAGDQKQLAGTPAYMAPELARRDASALGPHTDVYLVGATLHFVLTGKPRHLGENVFDAFYSAIQSEPVEYGDSLPEEIARILNRCTAADPRQRYATVTEVRVELERALSHRSSERLAAHGRRAAQDFERALADGADDIMLRDLFWVAHGYFRAALEEWPDNEPAHLSASSIAQKMTQYDISRGSTRPVSDVLDRLTTGSTPRSTARTAAEVPLSQPAPGNEDRRRTRIIFLGANCVVWTLFPVAFLLGSALDLFAATLFHLQIGAVVVWALLVMLVAVLGPAFWSDLRNRALVLPLGAILTASFAIQFYAVQTSVDAMVVLNQHHLLFFVVSALLAGSIHVRLLPMAGAYLAAFVASAALPDLTLWFMAASNAVGLGWSAVFMSRYHDVVDRRVQ